VDFGQTDIGDISHNVCNSALGVRVLFLDVVWRKCIVDLLEHTGLIPVDVADANLVVLASSNRPQVDLREVDSAKRGTIA